MRSIAIHLLLLLSIVAAMVLADNQAPMAPTLSAPFECSAEVIPWASLRVNITSWETCGMLIPLDTAPASIDSPTIIYFSIARDNLQSVLHPDAVRQRSVIISLWHWPNVSQAPAAAASSDTHVPSSAILYGYLSDSPCVRTSARVNNIFAYACSIHVLSDTLFPNNTLRRSVTHIGLHLTPMIFTPFSPGLVNLTLMGLPLAPPANTTVATQCAHRGNFVRLCVQWERMAMRVEPWRGAVMPALYMGMARKQPEPAPPPQPLPPEKDIVITPIGNPAPLPPLDTTTPPQPEFIEEPITPGGEAEPDAINNGESIGLSSAQWSMIIIAISLVIAGLLFAAAFLFYRKVVRGRRPYRETIILHASSDDNQGRGWFYRIRRIFSQPCITPNPDKPSTLVNAMEMKETKANSIHDDDSPPARRGKARRRNTSGVEEVSEEEAHALLTGTEQDPSAQPDVFVAIDNHHHPHALMRPPIHRLESFRTTATAPSPPKPIVVNGDMHD